MHCATAFGVGIDDDYDEVLPPTWFPFSFIVMRGMILPSISVTLEELFISFVLW